VLCDLDGLGRNGARAAKGPCSRAAEPRGATRSHAEPRGAKRSEAALSGVTSCGATEAGGPRAAAVSQWSVSRARKLIREASGCEGRRLSLMFISTTPAERQEYFNQMDGCLVPG